MRYFGNMQIHRRVTEIRICIVDDLDFYDFNNVNVHLP